MTGTDRWRCGETLAPAPARFPEVLDAFLFGTAALGENGVTSDVDLAAYLDEGLNAAERSRVALELAAESISRLGRDHVDVTPFTSTPLLLYHRVPRDGERLLSHDQVAATRCGSQALSSCCDGAPERARIEAAHRRQRLAGELGK